MPDQQPRRFSPTLIALFVIVTILILVVAIRSSTRETVDVRVSPVTHENLVSTVPTNGTVEPINEFQAHAMAGGTVQKIYVDVGQKVKKGDLLLQLDNSDALSRVTAAKSALTAVEAAAKAQSQGGTQDELIANEAELARAQQQQHIATNDVQTLTGLEAKGAASAAEVLAAQQRLDAAESALATARKRMSDRYSPTDRTRMAAQLTEARTSLEAAENGYEKVVVRAPFPGTVYSIAVNAYDFVSGGEDLLDLADLTRMHVRAYFDEPEIGKLAAGQPVRIVWDAKPDRSWHGHVEVAPTTVIKYGTRSVGEALITVDDTEGDLLPNTNVTVTVTTRQRFNVLSIPREALHTEGTTNLVYRVVNHHLQRTLVQVGIVTLTRVEIVSGLTEKDIVALNATSNRDLYNGLGVRSVE